MLAQQGTFVWMTVHFFAYSKENDNGIGFGGNLEQRDNCGVITTDIQNFCLRCTRLKHNSRQRQSPIDNKTRMIKCVFLSPPEVLRIFHMGNPISLIIIKMLSKIQFPAFPADIAFAVFFLTFPGTAVPDYFSTKQMVTSVYLFTP